MFIEAHLALASQFCSGQFLATNANFAFCRTRGYAQLWAETIVKAYHQSNHCKTVAAVATVAMTATTAASIAILPIRVIHCS